MSLDRPGRPRSPGRMATNLEQAVKLIWTGTDWKDKRDKAQVPGKLTKEVSMTDSFQAVHDTVKASPLKLAGALKKLDEGITKYLAALKAHDAKSPLLKSLEYQQTNAVNLASGLRVAYAMVGTLADETAEIVAIFTEFQTTQADAKAKPEDKKAKREAFQDAVEWFGERVRGNMAFALASDKQVQSIGNRLVQLGQGLGSAPKGVDVDVSGFKPIMGELEEVLKEVKKIKDADKITSELKGPRYVGTAKTTKKLSPRMNKWLTVWK